MSAIYYLIDSRNNRSAVGHVGCADCMFIGLLLPNWLPNDILKEQSISDSIPWFHPIGLGPWMITPNPWYGKYPPILQGQQFREPPPPPPPMKYPFRSGLCRKEEGEIRFCLFLLCLISRRILWIFFSCLPGNFALKNGGDFWWIFSGLRLPRNEARKVLEKFGENSEQNSGQNSDENSKNSGNFRSATFLT